MAQLRKVDDDPAAAAAPGSPVSGARDLTARSVVASTLLGMDPPELSPRLLVRSGELFGIAEGTTRVALSRMVTAGELELDGGRYRLAGRLLARHRRQIESRQGGAARTRWSGEWELRIVGAAPRAARDRTQLRQAMRQLKLAEEREGVWLRPANLHPARSPDAAEVVVAQCSSYAARPDEDPAALAARLWDLDGWAARAEELRAAMAVDVGRLEARDTDALAPTFVVAAAVLRHLLADPQLPDALCPPGWPGAALRADYDRYDRAFTAVWRDWFRKQR